MPDKSIVVAAESGHVVNLTSTVALVGGSPASHVTLRGLNLHSTHPVYSWESGALEVMQWQGVVWLEECTLLGGDADSFGTGTHSSGASVESAPQLIFVRCNLEGGAGGL